MQLGQTEIIVDSSFNLPGSNITILKYLNQGASANIFLAKMFLPDNNEKAVVVKALRPGMGGMFREEFKNEASTIQQIEKNWGFVYPEQKHPLVVPEYYDGVLENCDFPFIVEEFIEGQTLDKAILTQDHGRFSEKDALWLASQIGHVLVILHECIGKCYGDIKFDNFYMVFRDGRPSLKILDWNVLADKDDQNVRKDMLYVSTYLFYLLTGDSITIKEDLLKIKQEPETFPSFQNLSAAAQQFLLKALHPDPEQRFKTARSWLDEIVQYLKWWDENPKALLERAQELAINVGTGSKSFSDLYTVQKMASIAQANGADGAAVLLTETAKNMDVSSLATRIRGLLKSKNISSAANVFTSIMDKEQSSKNAELVLLGLASIAANNGSSNMNIRPESLVDAVDARLKKEYESAADQLRGIASQLPPAPQGNGALTKIDKDTHPGTILGALENEARLQGLVARLGSHTLQDQKTLLNQMNPVYQMLPDLLKRLVLENMNIPARLQQVDKDMQELAAAEGLVEKARLAGDTSQAAEFMRQALTMTVAKPAVMKALKGLVTARFQEGKYAEAQLLARLPRQNGSQDDWFEGTFAAAGEIQSLKENFNRLGLNQPVELISACMRRYASHASFSVLFSGSFLVFFEDVFHSALRSYQFDTARALASLAQDYHFQNAAKIEAEMKTVQRAYCDDLLIRAEAILKSSPVDQEKLNKACALLDAVRNDENRDLARFSAAEEQYQRVKNAYYAEQRKIQDTEELIKAHTAKLNTAKQQYEILEQASKFCLPEVLPGLRQEMGRALLSYLVSLAELEKLPHTAEDLAERRSWGDQKLNDETLTRTWSFINEQMRARQSLLERTLENDLNEGRLEQVSRYLKMNAGQFPHLQQKCGSILAFNEWSIQPDIQNADPAEWLKKQIPAPYWKDLSVTFANRAHGLLQNFQLEMLPDLARYRLISLMKVGPDAADQGPHTSWETVCETAQALDIAQQARDASLKEPTPEEARLKELLQYQIDHLKNCSVIQGAPKRILVGKPQTTSGPTKPRKAHQTPWRMVGYVAGGVVILAVVFAALWASGLVKLPVVGAPAATPTPAVSAIIQTEEATPTTEPTATFLPTPTQTPTEVPPTATAAPISKFAVTQMPEKAPSLPQLAGAGTFYIIDDKGQEFSKNWIEQDVNSGLGGSMHVLNAASNNDAVTATWKMDVPLPEDGMYEIFVLDAAASSGMDKPIAYQVMASEGKVVPPVTGSGSLKLLTNSEQGKEDLWRSLGVYPLKAGDMLAVSLNIQPKTVTGAYLVGADAVLITRLRDIKTDAGPGKNLADKKQTALFVFDDDQASYNPVEGWQVTENDFVWNRSFHQIYLADKPVSAKWQFTLPAGEYGIQMFIPQELTARVDFTLTLDGKEVPGMETKNLTVNGGGASGTHYPEKPWSVSVPENSKGQVVIEMKSSDGAKGVFACDAIVVLPVQK